MLKILRVVRMKQQQLLFAIPWTPNIKEVKTIEKDVENTCRLCMDSQGKNKDDVLISPCMCKGTQQFVHRSCLDQWRSFKEAGNAFSHGTTCKAQFHLRARWTKNIFGLLVDLAAVIFFTELVIIAVPICLLKNSFIDDKEDDMLSRHTIYYYCIGGIMIFQMLIAIVCFFAYIMAIRRITFQTPSHILSMREQLTQEYVIEDLHGCYTPAKLDPKHEERLKKLNLF